MPERETRPFPTLMQLGMRNNKWRYLYKPTPRNLRYFSHSPFARRAINAIKNPIKMLDWEITPLDGIDLNPELEKQIEVATTCFNHPNYDALIECLPSREAATHAWVLSGEYRDAEHAKAGLTAAVASSRPAG